MVPLKTIDYNLEIVNSLVHVTLEQEYENPSNHYLGVYYSFPMKPQYNLYKFQAIFENIVVEGVIKEKTVVLDELQKAKRRGKNAVIMRVDDDNKNIIYF